MGEHPTEDEIVEALSKSGYLLEQQVANKLEALSHYVWTNEAFQDVDEGKSREIDVKARKQFFHSDELNISGWTEIIAECKNMSSPLVFIGRNKSDVDYGKIPSEIIFPISEYHKPLKRDDKNKVTSYSIVPAFDHFGLEDVHWQETSTEKAVQFCRLERGGKAWRASHAGMYESLFFPMAKALKAMQAPYAKQSRGEGWKSVRFYIPIVVVSSKIYFTNQSSGGVKLEERGHVTFTRQIKTENTSGEFSLTFVNIDSLEDFITQCIDPVTKYIAAKFEKEPERFTNQVIDKD